MSATEVRAPARPAPAWPATVHRYRYPLVALVRRELAKRYATSVLGVGWTIAQPLVLIGIYVGVFGFIMKSGRTDEGAREFVVFMLCGMLPYLALSDGIQRAVSSLREDRALLDRADFPAEVLPAAKVIAAAAPEAVGLLILVVAGAFLGLPTSAWLLALPLVLLLRVVLTCGCAWVVSTLSLFVTDLAELLSPLLMAWLLLTPIFYAASDLPPALRWMLWLNPLHYVIDAYRMIVIDGRAPWPPGVIALLWAAALAVIGLRFFRKTLDRGKDFLS